MQSLVLQRSDLLLKEKLKAGDEVRVDANYKVAIEVLARPHSDEYYLDTVPELPWEKVGGQQEALAAIRDAIELPLLHPDLFRALPAQHAERLSPLRPARLRQDAHRQGHRLQSDAAAQARDRQEMREYFMHIKGPEILNMWVGESERMVREIFATAREKRREGYLPFLFIDEAESILGTRRASRYSNILSTLVPMFCTEMDGIESLSDVVIILASNRADLIDPAILRPGRIDRKIKVRRPTHEGAREIFKIYLAPNLPYDPALVREAGSVPAAIEQLIDKLIDLQFSHRDENRFLSITLRSGKKETLYRGDLISGAIIASIVERAKGARDQARHRQRAGGGDQQGRPPRFARRRVSGKRHFPAERHHRGLAAAPRLRRGERGQSHARPGLQPRGTAERGGVTCRRLPAGGCPPGILA